MDDLIKMNQSVAEVIEKRVKIFKMSVNLLNKLINLLATILLKTKGMMI